MKSNEILIIYDYERIVPPFMQSLIKFAQSRFDQIYYITPPLPDHYSKTIDYPNVHIVLWTKAQRIRQYIAGILSPFRLSFWKELRKGKIDLKIFKATGQLFFAAYGFSAMSKPFIKRHLQADDKVYLLGTWMGVDAYVAARMKQQFPKISGAYALAHSGEVMPSRNPHLKQCFHEYKHQHLDKVYFISEKVLDEYYDGMSDFNVRERFGNKIKVQHLGSINEQKNINPANESDTFHILSCSRIDANKRVHRIAEALEGWSKGKVKWTHIGTGDCEGLARAVAEKTATINPLVDVEFTGRLDNKDVIKYFVENPVDVFTNVSKSEGLPISIMEAMSFGVPCIATNVGGSSDIVNSQNGIIITPDFTDYELLSAIETIRDMNDDETKHLRNNAFVTWDKEFNAQKNANRLFDDWGCSLSHA